MTDHMTSEVEIAEAIIAYLRTAGGRATIREIINALPDRLPLTREDMRKSDTRPGERLWEQRVRNIRSHRNTMEGRLLHVDSGFRLGKKATERRKRSAQHDQRVPA